MKQGRLLALRSDSGAASFCERAPHSMVMLPSRTTLPHLPISSVTKAAKRAVGVPPGAAPCSSHIFFRSSAANAFATAAYIAETMAASVPAGAHSPYHDSDSKPASPASAAVGMSGKAGERSAENTASALALPLQM